MKRRALWRRRLIQNKILIFFPKQLVKNPRDFENAVSSSTHHKFFAFLSASLECSETFTTTTTTTTTTTDMIVPRSLFTQRRHNDQCKQALQYAT